MVSGSSSWRHMVAMPDPFGEAIAGDDGLEPQAGPHLEDHLHRDGGGPGHRQAQGGHVEAV